MCKFEQEQSTKEAWRNARWIEQIRLSNKPLGLPTTALVGQSKDEKAIAICDGVIDIVAELTGVPSRHIRSRERMNHDISRVRQIGMYVARTTCQLTMQQVGTGFSRDRTTVNHACRTIEELRDDEEFDQMIVQIERVVSAAMRMYLPAGMVGSN